jgi:hypothetical protein
MTEIERIRELERHVEKLSHALGTLMVWIGSSANSPIRQDEVEQLLKMLPQRDE